MAAVTEHDDGLAEDARPLAWDLRPIVGNAQGLPWWGAILLGFGLALFGAIIDIQLNDEPTSLFKGVYVVACVAAICLVRRRSLFAPMVQPPLILAAVLPAVLVYQSGPPDSLELKEVALTYGLPVINSFPVMAVATGATLLIGIARLLIQRDPDRKDDEAPPRASRKRRGAVDDVDEAAAPTRAVKPTAASAAAVAAAERRRPARERDTGERRRPPRDEVADRFGKPTPPRPAQPPERSRRAAPLDAQEPTPGRRPAGEPRPRPRQTGAPMPPPPGRPRRPERPWETDPAGPPPPGGRGTSPPRRQPPPRRPPPGAPTPDEEPPPRRVPPRQPPPNQPPPGQPPRRHRRAD